MNGTLVGKTVGRKLFLWCAVAVAAGCADDSATTPGGSRSALTPVGPYPNLATVVKPNPEPSFPSGFDQFAPPVNTSTPASGVPVITTVAPPVAKPDDTLTIIGERLSALTGTDTGKDVTFNVFGQTSTSNATETSALVQRLNGREAAATLPAGLPANSMYLIWPRNQAGYGRPVAINRAEAWWLGTSTSVTRGDTVAVYGRNLSKGQGTTNSYVYLKPSSGTGQWATVTSVNPYRVAFTVPTSLVNGNYEVWVHNGHGRSFGWSSPLNLTVSNPDLYTGPVFNVRNHGAVGDGMADDSAGINAALAAAQQYLQNNPGTTAFPSVYLPTGTYMVSLGFGVPSNIRWYGDGKDSTFIKCNSAFTTPMPGSALKFGIFVTNGGSIDNVEIKDMTLDANGNMTPEGGANLGQVMALGNISSGKNLRLRNLRIKTLIAGVQPARFGQTAGVTIENSEIYNNLLFILCTQVKISNTAFIGNNNVYVFLHLYGSSQVTMTQNTFRDFNSADPVSGMAQGRVLAGLGNWGSQRDVYFGDNVTTDLAVSPAFDNGNSTNTGEQIMYEGQAAWHKGTPSSAGPSSVSFNNLSMDFTGYNLSAVVVNGTGLGQYRQITAFNPATGTFTLKTPWVVPPDGSSKVLIASTAERLVVYHNTLDGKDDFRTRTTSASGIEPYGGCYDWIGDSNTMTDFNYAMPLFAVQQTGALPSTQPVWYNYYANNDVKRCNNGVLASAPEVESTEFEGVSFLGNSWRSNTFTDIGLGRTEASAGGIYLYGLRTSTPGGLPMHTNLWEHNTLTNVRMGVNAGLDSPGEVVRATDLVFYKNAFSRGTAALAGSFGLMGGTTQNLALRQNSWTGFESTYLGSLPGAVLEVPRRMVTINATTNGARAGSAVSLWNSGTSSLTWTASEDGSWLSLGSTGGTIANENSTGTINLIANPAGLSAGTRTATLTVNGPNGQVKKVTVTFVVSSTAGLPTPWVSQDIGSGVQAGGAGYSNSQFTLEGAGSVGGTSDGLRYLHQSASGDCDIRVRVSNLQNSAGVMIRESLNSNSRQVSMSVLSGGGVRLTHRSSTGGSTTTTNSSTSVTSTWVRLNRSGNRFTAYHSADGSNWTQLGSPSISMSSSTRMGLATFSGATSTLSTAQMNSVTATP